MDGLICEHEHLGVFVKQLRQPQVSHALLRKLLARYQLQTFHLAEVRGVAEHVDEQQLGHVAVPGRKFRVGRKKVFVGVWFREQFATSTLGAFDILNLDIRFYR